MSESKQGRRQRSIWSFFTVEEAFKQRQLSRLLLLTGVQVAVSTAAFVAFHRYEFAMALQDGAIPPRLVQVTIGFAALMSGVGGLFALWMGLLLTQRLAGPLYHFKRELQAIEAGAPPREIRVRKGNELQDMADALNGALQALWARGTSESAGLALDLEELRSAHEEILGGIAALDVSELTEPVREKIEAWRGQMRALGDKLEQPGQA